MDVLGDGRQLGSKRLRTALDTVAAMASTGVAASAAENMGANAQSSFHDNTIITDSTTTWINLQVMCVFLLGLFIGMVLLYWMLFGTAAPAVPFYRLWNYCLSCFRGRRAFKGEGKGKGFGSNTVT